MAKVLTKLGQMFRDSMTGGASGEPGRYHSREDWDRFEFKHLFDNNRWVREQMVDENGDPMYSSRTGEPIMTSYYKPYQAPAGGGQFDGRSGRPSSDPNKYVPPKQTGGDAAVAEGNTRPIHGVPEANRGWSPQKESPEFSRAPIIDPDTGEEIQLDIPRRVAEKDRGEEWVKTAGKAPIVDPDMVYRHAASGQPEHQYGAGSYHRKPPEKRPESEWGAGFDLEGFLLMNDQREQRGLKPLTREEFRKEEERRMRGYIQPIPEPDYVKNDPLGERATEWRAAREQEWLDAGGIDFRAHADHWGMEWVPGPNGTWRQRAVIIDPKTGKREGSVEAQDVLQRTQEYHQNRNSAQPQRDAGAKSGGGGLVPSAEASSQEGGEGWTDQYGNYHPPYQPMEGSHAFNLAAQRTIGQNQDQAQKNRSYLKSEEGYRRMPYIDPVSGEWHVGHGHKITESEAIQIARDGGWGKEKAGQQLDSDIGTARQGADQLFRKNGVSPEKMPPGFREAISNMVFQMGAVGVARFEDMWAAIRNGDWQRVLREMKDSAWAKSQTPERAQQVIAMARSSLSVGGS